MASRYEASHHQQRRKEEMQYDPVNHDRPGWRLHAVPHVVKCLVCLVLFPPRYLSGLYFPGGLFEDPSEPWFLPLSRQQAWSQTFSVLACRCCKGFPLPLIAILALPVPSIGKLLWWQEHVRRPCQLHTCSC